MQKSTKYHYEIEHFFPDVDRQKFFDMFIDPDAWSASEFLPGKIIIDKPGKDFPQGLGAVRIVDTGSMKIKEDIVGFKSPEYFSYASRNGSLPVNEFGGELRLEDHNGGTLAKYKGSYNSRYFGTGWFLKPLLRSGQQKAFVGLGKAYNEMYGENK